ncbi:hypothetical protein FPHYL_10176 [Fusarium phyllophilum]|uniref:PD-(D/E)XK nuclease-like domain-containing protein n=1 Tax=Fusarium phyllophilum TaxID=47803 RepID=A0A8H5J3Q4_9HYPO|nr:hypothetical protein FPHYL_10176 [Fusarium phyllophilum]
MENSGQHSPSDSEMAESRLKRARNTGFPSDDEENQPAKKFKFKPISLPTYIPGARPEISYRHTIPSPIDASSPPTRDNQLPNEVDCDSDAASSQAADYQYVNHWVDFKTLYPDHNDMPATLKMFMVSLLALQKDKKIIPNTVKDEIETYPGPDCTLAMLDDDSYYVPDESESACTKGLFDAVIKIAKAAEKCHSRHYDENGWGNLVYTPLLTAALDNFSPEPHLQHQLVDVAPCSTATIDPEWHRKSVPKGQVDFVLYIDPCREPIARDKCLARRDRVGSVNHTQFIPTAEFPIAASIKSKSHQGSSQDAEVQLAAWQAAQWHKMDIAVGNNISELGFLPGIIIDGHEWRFHATTYGLLGNKTVGLVPIRAKRRMCTNVERRHFGPAIF